MLQFLPSVTTRSIPWLTAGIILGLGSSALQAQEVIELPGRDTHIEPEFEEVYRVGTVEGEPWETFGKVNKVAFDSVGNLFVFDGLGSSGVRILVFNSTGGFLHEFGTPGQGPGEFHSPADFAVLRDGTTVVMDLGHRAYQLFDNSGQYLRMVRTTNGTPGGVASSPALRADPRGGAVFAGGLGTSIVLSEGGGSVPAMPPKSRPVTRVGLNGEVIEVDTVANGWLPHRRGSTKGMAEHIKIGDGTLGDALDQIAFPSIFEPPLLVGVLPDGSIVYSDSSTYVVKITSPDSREVARIVWRPFDPEPVTRAIKRDYEERRAARVGSQPTGGADDRVGFALERPYYHEIPVLHDLSTTWEGRIWVQRRDNEPESGGPIDVLTPEGEYIGTYAARSTQMPDAFGPEGLAAFIELGDFEVPSVVVRRLPAEVR
jgi:hypothetical protein